MEYVIRCPCTFRLTTKSSWHFASGKGPSQPAPKFVGNFIASILNLVRVLLHIQGYINLFKYFSSDLVLWNQIGPKGLEFARYSLDYHTIRNYLYTNRTWGKARYNSICCASCDYIQMELLWMLVNWNLCRADQHTPSYAKKIVELYNQKGQIDQMLQSKWQYDVAMYVTILNTCIINLYVMSWGPGI